MAADYEKASGNKLDYQLIPYAALRQKAISAITSGVVPDMITFAKGVTSGTAPMGGVVAKKAIHDAFMRGPEHVIELFHGYTYSAHPLACAAGLATLDVYRDENLFGRVRGLEPAFADAVMGLKGLPNVVDIRTVGLMAAIELEPQPQGPPLLNNKTKSHANERS